MVGLVLGLHRDLAGKVADSVAEVSPHMMSADVDAGNCWGSVWADNAGLDLVDIDLSVTAEMLVALPFLGNMDLEDRDSGTLVSAAAVAAGSGSVDSDTPGSYYAVG